MPRPDRYQVLVRERDPRTGVERELRVGPILTHRSILDDWCATVNKNVALGREKTWRDAYVVKLEKIAF